MPSNTSKSVPPQPEIVAVTQSQTSSRNVSSKWKWLLYVAGAVALVLAVKFFHVQALLKGALDWIGKL